MQSVGVLGKYTTVSVAFLATLFANTFVWQSPMLGLILLMFFLSFYGGSIWGAAAIIASLSLYGSVAYYGDFLNQTTVLVGLITTVLVIGFFHKTHPGRVLTKYVSFIPRSFSLSSFFLVLSFFVLFLASLSLLLHHPILTPIRSPWLAVPVALFLLVFLMAWLLSSQPRRSTLVLFFFLAIGVALLAYPFGYGFDSFIHKATEQHIFEHGTITPKPLYYAGQYALVLTAAHGFSIPVAVADSWLVPLLAAALLPLAAYRAFRSALDERRSLIASLALFFVPLSSFIATTPQGLANLWSLLVIFATLSFLKKQEDHHPMHTYALPILFAAAALATHPLAGIPAGIYLVLIIAKRICRPVATERQTGPVFYLLSFVSLFILPAIFFLNARLSGLPLSFNPSSLFQTSWADILQIHLFFENRYHSFLDAAYLWGWNRMIILIIIAMSATWLIKKKKIPHGFTLPIIVAGIMLVNYLLLSTVVGFDFLIDYERGNYSARVFDMMLFFLLPIIGLILAWLDAQIEQRPIAIRFGWSLLLAIILTSTVYLTYPRHDNYEISRGFNVGASDFDTVRAIHDQAKGTDYVVLANQAVSAAAMQEYGFLKYYQGDIFYYPIPTGGSLYQIYLDMVNNGPTAEKAAKATKLTGAKTVYFVVNDYWWMAEKVVENAKKSADSWFVIDNGATTVFVYEQK